ncbi:MAG: PAS domain-containing protein [Micropepsaceae bacterium]
MAQNLDTLMAAFPGRWAAGDLLSESNPHIVRLRDLWRARADGRRFPAAGTIGPVELKAVLPDVHIYTVAPDAPRYRIRLIGTRMTEHMGRNLTGLPVDNIPSETLRRAVTGILGAVELAQTTLHLMAPRAIALPNGDHKALESLWMPCADDGETIDRIIAVSLLSNMT